MVQTTRSTNDVNKKIGNINGSLSEIKMLTLFLEVFPKSKWDTKKH